MTQVNITIKRDLLNIYTCKVFALRLFKIFSGLNSKITNDNKRKCFVYTLNLIDLDLLTITSHDL